MAATRLRPRLARGCSSVAYHAPGTTLLPPLARLGLDLTFWRNKMIYTSLTQPPFLSEEFPTASARSVPPRDHCVEWCPPSDGAPGPSAAVESPHQPGLWLLRGALTAEQCQSVAASVRALTRDDAVQGYDGVPVRAPCSPLAFGPGEPPRAQPAWEWFEYWPARCMVPLQPVAGVDGRFAREELAVLQSHNCTDAREWPLLRELPGAGGEALRLLERTPLQMVAPFATRAALFVQLQAPQPRTAPYPSRAHPVPIDVPMSHGRRCSAAPSSTRTWTSRAWAARRSPPRSSRAPRRCASAGSP